MRVADLDWPAVAQVTVGMSIIEQAAKRLDELRRAGVEIPWDAAGLAAGDTRARMDVKPALASPHDVATLKDAAGDMVARRSGAGEAPATARPEHAAKPLAAPDAEFVTLDLAQLERGGQVVPADSRSALAEEFRHIKRPLLRNARNGKPEDRASLIMVTSALPGEGKTFCAINLAMTLAIEIDVSVLLVDADVLRPSMLSRLGLAPRKGLLDLLGDDCVQLSDVVLTTNVPKLSLLPAGTYNSRSTELLASEAMDRLLSDLALRCRDYIVVFDAPPLLLTNEAKVLASRVGQVLMVVQAFKTPRAAVERAFAAVEQCPTVMSLLNRGSEPSPHYGYAGYYG
jgi:receptor protein-tyrosine kinase